MFSYYNGNYISMTGQKEHHLVKQNRANFLGLKYFCV